MRMPPEPAIPATHTLVSTPRQALRDGYWLARDHRGYEYVVGARIERLPDGGQRHVKTDAWGRETVHYRGKGGEWTAQTTPEEPPPRRWYAEDDE